MSTVYEFSDADPLETVSVPSTWRQAAPVRDAETETIPLTFTESETQTTVKVTSETQTEEEDRELVSEQSLQFDGWDAPADIVDFLHNVAPMMTAQLELNINSHAFDDFDVFGTEDEDEAACLHSLTYRWVQPSDDTSAEGALGATMGAGAGAGVGSSRGGAQSKQLRTDEQFPCTGVAWSSTGSVLCASFGRLDHEGWCTHRAGLATWNVFRREFDPDTPDNALETSSCLMCVACHPLMPSVVVGGTYNGEVIVWDTNRDEPLVASSRIDDYLHREPINQVAWFFDLSEREYFIASTSGDGKVLFWTLRNNLEYPLQGFRLTPAVKRKGESRAKRIVVGGTALSFTNEGKMNSSFVVGSEGGGLYRCLLRHRAGGKGSGGKSAAAAAAAMVKTGMSWNDDAIASVARMPDKTKVVRHVERYAREKGAHEVTMATMYDAQPEASQMFPNPVDFKYQPHTGPVHALDCSPFHRNLFLSAGSDGRVSVFTVLAAPPLLTVEPAVGSGTLYAAAFSRTRPLVFAVGGSSGGVYLYDLQQNTSAPAEELLSTEEGHVAGFSHSPAILALQFNPKQRKLLAAGDADGKIRVWRLSWRMSNEQPKESAQLDKFMGVSEGL